jgi:hypothetical protein
MTQAQQARWQMRQKVTSPEGRAIYGRRKVIAEPVFGQIKQARGFRRFSLRGLAKVASEKGIVCLCQNVLKLFRAPARQAIASSSHAQNDRRRVPRRSGAATEPSKPLTAGELEGSGRALLERDPSRRRPS